MTKNNSSHVDQEDQAALGSLPALDPQSDRVISGAEATAEVERAPGQGLKPQAKKWKLNKFTMNEDVYVEDKS